MLLLFITGIYDAFVKRYAYWALYVFQIPRFILPKVVECSGSDFGILDPEILDSPIPIRAVMADQSASAFACGLQGQGQGHGGRNEVKMSLGTGSFLDVCTGSDHHDRVGGVVPLVAWKHRGDLQFMAETCLPDTSALIALGLSLGT